MKTINETFTEDEYNRLKKRKGINPHRRVNLKSYTIKETT